MLPIHEADLVRRDVAIPGLAKLLDPEAFLAALQAFVPGTKFLAARPNYIRYKPGVNCLVAYQLETADNLIEVYAKAHGSDALTKVKKAALPKTVPGPLGPGRVVIDNCATVVSFFPNDSNLKRLYRLNETEVRDHLHGKFLPGTADAVTAKMEKLAYKPERRYVARLATNSGSKAVLKFYTQRTFLSMRVNAKAFRSSDLLRIPRCLEKSYRHSVLGFEWLSGRFKLICHQTVHPRFVPDIVRPRCQQFCLGYKSLQSLQKSFRIQEFCKSRNSNIPSHKTRLMDRQHRIPPKKYYCCYQKKQPQLCTKRHTCHFCPSFLDEYLVREFDHFQGRGFDPHQR